VVGLLHRLAERLAGHDEQQAGSHQDSCGTGQQRLPTILAEDRAVPLHAVDPVCATFELRER